ADTIVAAPTRAPTHGRDRAIRFDILAPAHLTTRSLVAMLIDSANPGPDGSGFRLKPEATEEPEAPKICDFRLKPEAPEER
ncbi:MAG TPA: hypothetical protein VF147_07905, partial [Vicinamibacterales bacterium]